MLVRRQVARRAAGIGRTELGAAPMSGGGGAVRLPALELDPSGVEQGVRRASLALHSLGDSAKEIEDQMRGVRQVLDMFADLTGISLSIEGIKDVVEEVGRSIMDFEENTSRITAVLKATGDASGLTRTQIAQLDDQLAHSTLFSADDIERATATLATFKNVQGDTFKQALKLSADLAQTRGVDIQSAATMIGRALDQPATGLVLLTRAGAGLSAAQRDMAKEMDEAGRKADAQKIIIDALTKSFGGTAEAANTGLAGAVANAKTSWHDFIDALANSPQIGQIAAAIDYVTDKLNPKPQNGSFLLDDFVTTYQKVQDLQKKIANESPSSVGQFRINRDNQSLAYYQNQLDELTKKIKAQSDEEEKEEAAAYKSAQAYDAARDAADARSKAEQRLQEFMKAGQDLVSQSKETTLSFGMNVQDPELAKAMELALKATDSAERAFAQSVFDAVGAQAKQHEVMQQQDDLLKKENEDWNKAKDTVDGYVKSLKDQIDALSPTITETQRYRDMIELARQTEGDAAAQQVQDLGKQVAALKQWHDEAEKALKQGEKDVEEHQRKWEEMFKTIADGFAGLFKNTLTGAIQNFQQFVQQMAALIEDLAAKLAAQQLVSLLIADFMPMPSIPNAPNITPTFSVPTLPTYHSGGIVGDLGIPRLHSGLAPDEFPAILQTGETVLPRGVGVGHTFSVNMYVSAMDSQDVARTMSKNSAHVAAGFFDAVQKNVMFQRALKHAVGTS